MATLTNDELDSLVFKHLSNLSGIISLTYHLEDSLSEGRLLLAKTRNNLSGNSCLVSATSYNIKEMSSRGASFRASVNEEKISFVGHEEFQTTRFHLVDELADKTLDSHSSVDPIRWFAGVLVPASLRRAQSCFRRAVSLSIELANRRSQLEVSSRYLKKLIQSRVNDDLRAN